VYSKKGGIFFIYVALYVDDMLLVGNNVDDIKEVKMQISSNFDMKDLSANKFILGMEIERHREVRKLWLNHKKYAEIFLKCFNMWEYKEVKVPIPVGVKLIVE
jgi:hypothetical protein